MRIISFSMTPRFEPAKATRIISGQYVLDHNMSQQQWCIYQYYFFTYKYMSIFYEDNCFSYKYDPCIQPTKTRLISGQSIYQKTTTVTLIYIIFSKRIFFFPDDTGIRTNEKTLRLIVHTGTINPTPSLYIPSSGTTLLDHNARPAQISPAIYSPAAQRSAVRSRAVRCRALRCGAAVSCCAVCFLRA